MSSDTEPDGSDAIALRAAISVLRLQRERAQADLRALERLKRHALAEPDRFTRELNAGQLQKSSATTDIVPSTGEAHGSRGPRTRRARDRSGRIRRGDDDAAPVSHFEPVPVPQNIVRCPHINWAKYHVVGESLDRLHAERRWRPAGDGEMFPDGARPPELVLAAPYRPFTDQPMTQAAESSGEETKGQ